MPPTPHSSGPDQWITAGQFVLPFEGVNISDVSGYRSQLRPPSREQRRGDCLSSPALAPGLVGGLARPGPPLGPAESCVGSNELSRMRAEWEIYWPQPHMNPSGAAVL